MKREFYSNGKLLLSGEYAILDGALGLAVPTKFGQSLQFENTESHVLAWESFNENNQTWFSGSFDLNHLDIISTSDVSTAKTLGQLLKEVKRQNPDFLSNTKGIDVTTHLGFPREWGLGTSSTLINNLAQWAQIDAYSLLWNAFGGSGYDIACAQYNTPIIYRVRNDRPMVTPVQFDPPFKDSLYFVYLNQKQSSKNAIQAYRKQSFDKEQLIGNINTITEKMITCDSLSDFRELIEKHEVLLSKILGLKPIKTRLFPDYAGSIKSLGAWGGDFILATGNEEVLDYFNSKGFQTIIPYGAMVL